MKLMTTLTFIKLKRFEASENTVKDLYRSTIAALSNTVSRRFENLSNCPVFKNLVNILDCGKWPSDEGGNLLSFGDASVTELIKHFTPLLECNNCNIFEIHAEWNIFKVSIKSFNQCKLQLS